METISQVGQAMRQVLTEVAEAAGRASGFVRRRRQVSGALFLQTLVFGWMADPAARLSDLAQTAALLGLPISPQGLAQRCTAEAAACVRQVLEAAVVTVIAGQRSAVPLLARFAAVTIQDSTHLPVPATFATDWPASGQQPGQPARAGLKVQVQWDLVGGQLVGLTLQPGRTQDRASPQQQTALPTHSLRLHDLGFFRLAVLATYAQQQVWTLCRLQVTTALFDQHGQRQELTALLAAADGPRVDQPITLGVEQQLPARLLAVRVSQEVADQRRRRLYADARRKGQPVSQARLAVADWTIYVTTAPAAWLTLEEALVLARTRWQIELLFKCWKSHGQLDQSRSRQPYRQLTELYAKLLIQVIQHWAWLAGGWASPASSGVKAARLVQHAAWWLAATLPDPAALAAALTRLVAAGAATCRLERRARHPSTAQRLLNPALEGLS